MIQFGILTKTWAVGALLGSLLGAHAHTAILIAEVYCHRLLATGTILSVEKTDLQHTGDAVDCLRQRLYFPFAIGSSTCLAAGLLLHEKRGKDGIDEPEVLVGLRRRTIGTLTDGS
jgi:hypothetical protein